MESDRACPIQGSGSLVSARRKMILSLVDNRSQSCNRSGAKSECRHRSRSLRKPASHDRLRPKPKVASCRFDSTPKIGSGSKQQPGAATKRCPSGFAAPCLPRLERKPVDFKLGHHRPERACIEDCRQLLSDAFRIISPITSFDEIY